MWYPCVRTILRSCPILTVSCRSGVWESDSLRKGMRRSIWNVCFFVTKWFAILVELAEYSKACSNKSFGWFGQRAIVSMAKTNNYVPQNYCELALFIYVVNSMLVIFLLFFFCMHTQAHVPEFPEKWQNAKRWNTLCTNMFGSLIAWYTRNSVEKE